MNLYSPDIIKKELHFDAATYHINRHLHEETFSVSYTGIDAKKSGTFHFIKKAAIHICIMELLDYDMPEKESSLTVFEKLKSSLPLLGIDCPFHQDKFAGYCPEYTAKDVNTVIGQIMLILQTCFETHPVLSYLYSLYYEVMRFRYLQGNKLYNADIIQATRIAEILSEEVENLNNLYTQAKNYLDAVIIKPAEESMQLPSSVIAEIYHSYCLHTRKQDFQSDALSSMELKTAFLPDRVPNSTSSDAHSDMQNWLEYLNNASAFVTDNAITKYPITSFKQFLYIGIRQMLEDELIIKNCKLCGGFFRVKYTSNQEYCTGIYRDTSTTCNEYASRKSYKEKLFSHPIHTEFTKSYNRLYARIRRGKPPADMPLMDQLKVLHDEYTEKYENTHQKDRETVWKEYIERNKELLKLNSSKS